MFMIKILGFLGLSITEIIAVPLSSYHLKIYAPPHVYEHQLTTHDGKTISQDSYFALERTIPRFGDKIQSAYRSSSPSPLPVSSSRGIAPHNAPFLQPVGVFVAPSSVNDLGYSLQDVSGRTMPDFSNRFAFSDPYLLTDHEAQLAAQYLYGRELFFHEIPHERTLLSNQQLRHANGLSGHILKSIRPGNEFCDDCRPYK